MKKLFVSAGLISAMFISSCNGGSRVCGCVNTMLEMGKEMSQQDADVTKIMEKYADDEKKCRAMDKTDWIEKYSNSHNILLWVSLTSGASKWSSLLDFHFRGPPRETHMILVIVPPCINLIFCNKYNFSHS